MRQCSVVQVDEIGSWGQAVEHGGDFAKLRIAATVAAQIGKSQVIGDDEDEAEAFHSYFRAVNQ
jgi:hypothetical protein